MGSQALRWVLPCSGILPTEDKLAAAVPAGGRQEPATLPGLGTGNLSSPAEFFLLVTTCHRDPIEQKNPFRPFGPRIKSSSLAKGNAAQRAACIRERRKQRTQSSGDVRQIQNHGVELRAGSAKSFPTSSSEQRCSHHRTIATHFLPGAVLTRFSSPNQSGAPRAA